MAGACKSSRYAWPLSCTIYVQRLVLFHLGTMRNASQNKVGIFLIAANPLLREALAHVLFTEAGFNVVGACAPGPDTESAVLKSGANLVLLDDFDATRSDLDLLRKLMTAAPSLKVILVGVPETERAFLDSIRAGAIGYVLHDASAGVLISSVRAVLNGEAVCPAGMIVSTYKYVPGSGITCPSFAHEGRQATHTQHAAPRARHFF
jgi:DNA-binding NarL/FixJ family response regulator